MDTFYALLHGLTDKKALSDGERLDEWRALRSHAQGASLRRPR